MLTQLAYTLELPDTDLPTSGTIDQNIISVINWGLFVAGTVAVLIIVVAGILYITAAGDEHRIERAKTSLKGAIIGVIIILLAAVIVNTINAAIFYSGGRSGNPSDPEWNPPRYNPRR
jgi:type IV secretory pathway VirB2 component (pilin)